MKLDGARLNGRELEIEFAHKRFDNFPPICVSNVFEVSNGFLGMRRDVILRLCCLICWEAKTIRKVLGMCMKILKWKKHSYFVSTRKTLVEGNPVQIILQALNVDNHTLCQWLSLLLLVDSKRTQRNEEEHEEEQKPVQDFTSALNFYNKTAELEIANGASVYMKNDIKDWKRKIELLKHARGMLEAAKPTNLTRLANRMLGVYKHLKEAVIDSLFDDDPLFDNLLFFGEVSASYSAAVRGILFLLFLFCSHCKKITSWIVYCMNAFIPLFTKCNQK